MTVTKEVVRACIDEMQELSVQIVGPETMGITGPDATLLLAAHKSAASMADTLTHETVHNIYAQLTEDEVKILVSKLLRKPEWRYEVFHRLSIELFAYAKEMATSWEDKGKG